MFLKCINSADSLHLDVRNTLLLLHNNATVKNKLPNYSMILNNTCSKSILRTVGYMKIDGRKSTNGTKTVSRFM